MNDPEVCSKDHNTRVRLINSEKATLFTRQYKSQGEGG